MSPPRERLAAKGSPLECRDHSNDRPGLELLLSQLSCTMCASGNTSHVNRRKRIRNTPDTERWIATLSPIGHRLKATCATAYEQVRDTVDPLGEGP